MKIFNLSRIALRFTALIIPLLLVSYSMVLGQNYLMSAGQDGMHSSVQFSYNTFENYYAVQPGYTFDGKLTIGMDIGKTSDMVNKLNSTVLRPSISYLIVKQNEEIPISFDINLAYQYNYVSQIIFNARAVQFGAGIYHEISPYENVKLVSAVLFEGSKITEGPTRLEEGVIIAVGAQASVLWNNKYYLTPKITIQEGVNTITLKVGMFFGNQEPQ